MELHNPADMPDVNRIDEIVSHGSKQRSTALTEPSWQHIEAML
jgi:hypothetical protein